MISTLRAIVQTDAIPDNITMEQFKDLIFRPNALVPVKDINGVKLDKLIAEIQNYYVAIDRYHEMIQRSLGINDAFMGFAPASSSGKKVQVQQQAAVVALEYFATPLADITQRVGEAILALARQYYRSHQVLRLTDKHTGERYVELNKPMMRPVLIQGQPIRDFQGNVIEEPFIQFATDPETEELLEDENGNYIIEPASDPSTAISIGEFDVMVTTGPSGLGEIEERNNMMELLGMAAQAMPQGTLLKSLGFVAREMKTPDALEISAELIQAGEAVNQAQTQQAAQATNTQALENAKTAQEIEQGAMR